MKNTRYIATDYEGIVEVKFPDEIVGGEFQKEVAADKFENFASLLSELDKQVNDVDGNVASLVSFKETLDEEGKKLRIAQKELEENRFAFERQMKEEYQKLNDLKIDFEQEKTKVFNEIQNARELHEKNKRTFEKFRQEQLANIEKSKKMLTKNYEQFEKIVSKFNEKFDKFDNQN